MKAFRLLALGYALLVLLIAPAWLAADESPLPTVPEAVEDPAGEAEEVLEETTGAADEQVDADDAAPVAKADERGDGAAKPKRDADEAKQAKKRSTRDAPAANAAQSNSVTITDFEFNPATITVNVGDTVTWTNEGPTDHTATAEDGSFDTGNLEQGESGSATFNEPGTIAYICTPHPFMEGKVVVRAAGAGGGGGSGGGGGNAGDTGGSTDTATGDDDSGTAGVDSASGDAGGGSSLASTGFEALIIALLGLATLAAGVFLRARTQT